jgi:Arc/MetJ-type ribon-helix-helix transcriptional regulator
MLNYERLEKHVAAFLHVMLSTETYRNVDDVMREARVPEDEAAGVAAYLEHRPV